MKRTDKHLSKAKSKKTALKVAPLLSLLAVLALGNSGGAGGGDGKKASTPKPSSLQIPRAPQSDN